MSLSYISSANIIKLLSFAIAIICSNTSFGYKAPVGLLGLIMIIPFVYMLLKLQKALGYK